MKNSIATFAGSQMNVGLFVDFEVGLFPLYQMCLHRLQSCYLFFLGKKSHIYSYKFADLF